MSCQHLDSKCIDSRQKDGYRIRRYQCKNPECKERFSTAEFIVDGYATNYHMKNMMSNFEEITKLSQSQLVVVKSLIEEFNKDK